jgi:NAD(P)-dependent dehydrogenase (short-subunit alcohol dehydrogenase family)
MRLEGKKALITGASRGIGKEVAVKFAKEGAHVILIARTVGALEEVDDLIKASGGKATLMPMDLLNLEEVDAIGPSIVSRFSGLDILIGNAGILGNLTPLTHSDTKEWDKVLGLNLTSNFRLLRTLDPLLKASSCGRAVFTSSIMALKATPYWGSYCVSKAALEMMVKVYAKENEKNNLCINLVDPGVVQTALLDKAYPGGYQGETQSIEEITNAFLELVSPECSRSGEIISFSNKATKVA